MLRRAAADLNVIAGLLILFLMATLFMGNNILGPELEGYGPRNSGAILAQFWRNSAQFSDGLSLTTTGTSA